MVNTDILLPIKLKDGFIFQFYDYISPKQVDVHFVGHYLKYLENTNKFIKDNMDIYKKTIAQVYHGNANLNSFDTIYMISLRSKFLQLFSKTCNVPARNNISQVFFHELYFTGITAQINSQEYFNIYFKDIFGNKENFKNFYKKYIDVSVKHFASGWTCFMYKNGMLDIIDTPNAIIPEGEIVYCVDLWEHAYYIDFLFHRKEYLEKFFLLINWEKIKKTMDFYKNKF